MLFRSDASLLTLAVALLASGLASGFLAGMFGIGDGSPTGLDELVPLAAGLTG